MINYKIFFEKSAIFDPAQNRQSLVFIFQIAIFTKKMELSEKISYSVPVFDY